MSKFKINQELQQLIKLGVPEDMALVVACANHKNPNEASDAIEMLKDEQQIIIEQLNNFIPLSQILNNEIYVDEPTNSSEESKDADLQH